MLIISPEGSRCSHLWPESLRSATFQKKETEARAHPIIGTGWGGRSAVIYYYAKSPQLEA